MNLLDLLFPRTCLNCGQLGEYVCSSCLNFLKPLNPQKCLYCHKPAMFGAVHSKCHKKLGLDGTLSVFQYQYLAKKLITRLKYKHVTDLYQTIVNLMISLGDWTPFETQTWTLVPVPLHPSRLRSRGFNQSKTLASQLANYFNWSTNPNLIKRNKNTPPQVSLPKDQRATNVRGAFSLVDPSQEPPPNIILVDDVVTTGATLKECTKILKRAGAQKVWGLTIAA